MIDFRRWTIRFGNVNDPWQELRASRRFANLVRTKKSNRQLNIVNHLQKGSPVTKHLFASLSASLGLLAAPALGQPEQAVGHSASAVTANSIEKIAPENTIFLVGIKNAGAALEHFKRTGLWELWQDDKLKKFREEEFKKFTEDLNKKLEELGVDKDSLAAPSGPVEFAVFPVTNSDTGASEPAFLLMADYGENAEKTESLIQAALTKGEKDGDLEVDHKDVNGRTVYSVDFSKLEKKMQEARHKEHPDEDEDAGMGMDLNLPPGMPNPKE